MKHFITLLICMSVACCTTMQAQNKDWANLKRYAKDNQTVLQLPKEKRHVVFMGNSITQHWVEFHPDFFSSNGYIGRGISGQTSYQFLVRFRQDVISLQPQLVVINAGTNDVAENTGPYNEDYTMGNIISMVELAQANGIKVILTSVLPAAGFGWNKSITDAPAKIKSLNKRIARYARKHDIAYVDYFKEMVADDKEALAPAYTKDGVHPTPEGYLVMEKIIKKAIEKVLR